MRVKLIAGALLTLALAVTIAACGSDSGSSSGTATSEATDTTQPASSAEGKLDCTRTLTTDEIIDYAVPQAKKPYKITLMEISLAGYYYQAVAYGAEKAAEEAGVDLEIVAAEGFATAPQQITQAENAITRGTEGIILGPVDVNGSVQVVTKANEAGVEIIVVGSDVNTEATKLLQDDYLQGQAAADALAGEMPEGGQGIVMGGPANATWSVGRVEGFEDRLAEKYPDIEVLSVVNSEVDPGEAVTKFTNAASADPNVEWIYSVYNLILPPESIPSQYKDAFYVGGALEPTTEEALANGEAVVIPDWPVTMGYIGVAELVSKLNGEEPPALTCIPSPVLTADDIDSPTAKAQLMPEGYEVKG